MTDVRREIEHVWDNYRRYHHSTGETIIWYELQPFGSTAGTDSLYDDVYDEGLQSTGGLRYQTGVIIPVVQIQETEDTKRAMADGRHPLQNANGVASVKDMRDAGISDVSEYRKHLNDMFFYDGRYYSISSYRVRGRGRDDVIITFEGIEKYLDQEFAFDPGPTAVAVNDYSWPAAFPT
ncbi:MAG: hypothetical protein CL724_11765 [Chloroflexi bacterium]|jgi:hypothetical protein|nr:hypothetical protein [Chloroflexota bacterium]|tara:strand:+ start:894 stop:1430 length:537 start_codon:yes stop_codon:yes gene_type:complete